jgi:acetoin:2,6-dichlorophenolindophenol oxidoreductase subunit alpha
MGAGAELEQQRLGGLEPAESLELLHLMIRVRAFEERVRAAYLEGLVHGTTHLCIGQEAVCVGVAACLGPDDYVTYTYRGHGICIARGMSMASAMAEIFGRTTGVSSGLGGSMHRTDPSLNLIASAGIVGGGVPVAVGAGLSAKLARKSQVSATLFGDGATNAGVFHESMNIAAVWKLPVVFVCENNLYGEFSRIDQTTPFENLALRGAAYAMSSVSVDGNDVIAVRTATAEAVERARNGGGPSFIECRTYRQSGHSRTDPGKYRPPGELEAWLARDPIRQFEERLIGAQIVSADQVAEMHRSAASEVKSASDIAAQAPWPDADAYLQHVLAPQRTL